MLLTSCEIALIREAVSWRSLPLVDNIDLRYFNRSVLSRSLPLACSLGSVVKNVILFRFSRAALREAVFPFLGKLIVVVKH